MDNYIIGKLFLFDTTSEEETIRYLVKLGFNWDRYKSFIRGNKTERKSIELDDEFTIEFREVPPIIKKLKHLGIYSEENPIYISSINEYGIFFYVIGEYLGDGGIFVPMSNIAAIHNVTKEQIKKNIYIQECKTRDND